MTAFANAQQAPKVMALVKDLMFTVKIQQAAKAAGITVTIVGSAEVLRGAAAPQISAMILDLNEPSFNPITLIADLKAKAPQLTILGYASHVHGDLIKAAKQAGCDKVVARSAFSQQLPELLQQLADDRLD